MGMGVVWGEREKGSCGEGERADGWARPRRRRCWAGLYSSAPAGLCVCVNVRGRVRDREKMREFCE